MADLLELTEASGTGVRAMTCSNPGHLAMDLDVTTEAVPIVRTVVRAHLKLWGLARLSDRVALTVTELLTNVLRHAQPVAHTGPRNARLTMTRLPGVLNVCVRDFDPVLPQPSRAEPDADAEHGRGLPLVIAFADAFGCSPIKGGKDMWANFLVSDNGKSESPQERRAS